MEAGQFIVRKRREKLRADEVGELIERCCARPKARHRERGQDGRSTVWIIQGASGVKLSTSAGSRREAKARRPLGPVA